ILPALLLLSLARFRLLAAAFLALALLPILVRRRLLRARALRLLLHPREQVRHRVAQLRDQAGILAGRSRIVARILLRRFRLRPALLAFLRVLPADRPPRVAIRVAFGLL